MKNCIINFDLFNISNRLKQIDKNYFLVRNKEKHRFEVHYKRNSNTLEIILPFCELDCRTINLVLKTRMENREKLIAEIEANNEKLKKQNEKKSVELAQNEFMNKIGAII